MAIYGILTYCLTINVMCQEKSRTEKGLDHVGPQYEQSFSSKRVRRQNGSLSSTMASQEIYAWSVKLLNTMSNIVKSCSSVALGVSFHNSVQLTLWLHRLHRLQRAEPGISGIHVLLLCPLRRCRRHQPNRHR